MFYIGDIKQYDHLRTSKDGSYASPKGTPKAYTTKMIYDFWLNKVKRDWIGVGSSLILSFQLDARDTDPNAIEDSSRNPQTY